MKGGSVSGFALVTNRFGCVSGRPKKSANTGAKFYLIHANTILLFLYICVENIMKVGHLCIHNLANPGTNKDCSYANTYSINTERPSKLKEKNSFFKETV
jgi:hypothetical protein